MNEHCGSRFRATVWQMFRAQYIY